MAHLTIEILGSGGAVRTPRPGCTCPRCEDARTHGIPYARTGPSLFVHGPNVLIDTPEESALQVDRSRATEIAAGFYSHWHPDHTRGLRMWETRNGDFVHWPAFPQTTPIYLPPRVRDDFARYGMLESLVYMQSMDYVRVEAFDGPIELGGWRITTFPVAEDYVYAFLFEEVEAEREHAPRRVLVCMDELVGWAPPAALRGVDLAVLPKGLFEFHPFHSERLIPADHPVLGTEATYLQTLEMVRALAPRRTVFLHIEEPEPLSPAQYERLSADLRQQEGWDVTFAHDTLVIELEHRPVA